MNKYLTILLIVFVLACKNEIKETPVNPTLLQHQCVQRLTDVIVYDIFTPPVASRIYAYSNLAFYEAYIGGADSLSMTSHLKGFDKIQRPTQPINSELAATIAFMKVAEALVFSKDSIRRYSKNILAGIPEDDTKKLQASTSWGEAVAAMILKRAGDDNYKKNEGHAEI